VGHLDEERTQRGQQLGVGHQHARAAVAQHRDPLLGPQPRVERHRHRPDAQRAEEHRCPLGPVGQQQRHPLLGLDPEATQRVARPAHQREQLAVAQGPRGTDDGGPVGGAAIDRRVQDRADRVGHRSPQAVVGATG
jgi:hypothetical protein